MAFTPGQLDTIINAMEHKRPAPLATRTPRLCSYCQHPHSGKHRCDTCGAPTMLTNGDHVVRNACGEVLFVYPKDNL